MTKPGSCIFFQSGIATKVFLKDRIFKLRRVCAATTLKERKLMHVNLRFFNIP
jgi:hypothetical protein